MSPPSWERVKPIVADAMELPTDERAAYLDAACASDRELRAEVESLLAAARHDSLPGVRASIVRAANDALAARDDKALRATLETALGQQYEILRQLGRGGMGAVYLARDTALERLVAIKVLRPDLAALDEGRERFRREARVIARLSHPGILPLYTFGEVNGTLYLVMSYVPGVTLAERLRVEGHLPPAEVARILGELADALECAHREGVIHRDIKPGNILLDDATGRAILADFGIAKIEGATDAITSTGAVLGTPDYMSPEQAVGQNNVDERSDIYSLGAVGVAMLTGHAPTNAVLPGSVPTPLSRIVTRCLAGDPTFRWPNARALREALAALQLDARPPESVRDLPAFGAYAALWALMWIVLSVTLRPSGDRALLVLIALLVPLGLILHVGNSGRSGLAALEVARIAFWPPEWWGMWWPKGLRRPGDLWSRLPRPARLLRIGLSAFIVALATVVLMRGPAADVTPSGWHDAVARVFDTLEVALVAVAGAMTIAGISWARRRSLSWSETVRVLFGPTVGSRDWESPRITALLRLDANIADPHPDSPTDHVRAIAEIVPLLPPSCRAAGADANRLAARLIDAIKQAEDEEVMLARQTSGDEMDRLAARVAALEASRPRHGTDELELITLLKRQLELVRGMRVRGVLASQRRARLLSHLRGLWAQLRAARATGSPDLVVEQCDRAEAVLASS